jgi:hypothetical protein
MRSFASLSWDFEVLMLMPNSLAISLCLYPSKTYMLNTVLIANR